MRYCFCFFKFKNWLWTYLYPLMYLHKYSDYPSLAGHLIAMQQVHVVSLGAVHPNGPRTMLVSRACILSHDEVTKILLAW